MLTSQLVSTQFADLVTSHSLFCSSVDEVASRAPTLRQCHVCPEGISLGADGVNVNATVGEIIRSLPVLWY